MPLALGLYLDRIELTRALFKREPYVVAVTVTANSRGTEVTVQTEPAPGIKKGKALETNMTLLEVGDPGEFIACHLLVMESDAGHRHAGARLEGAQHLLRQTQLARALPQGLGGAGVAVAALIEFGGVLGRLLQGDGDDVLLDETIRFSGEDLVARTLTVEGRRCTVTLRLAAGPEDVTRDVTPARKEKRTAAEKDKEKQVAPAVEPASVPTDPPAETGTGA